MSQYKHTIMRNLTNILWWETKRTYNTLHYTRENTMMRNRENIQYTRTYYTNTRTL